MAQRVRVSARGALPWGRPRYELLLLALVAVVALSPVVGVDAQDQSRLCFSEALLHGHLSNDRCLSGSVDFSRYKGQLYSDKAPGLSLLAVPAVAILRPGPAQAWSNDDLRLWGVRVLTVGLGFLLCAFLVGRVSEGLSPGYGGIALVSFSIGTIVAPLAGVSFEHVPAAALAFGMFLLAWSRRPALAGLVGGAALLFAYETGLILAVVGGYVAFAGWRPLRAFLVGVLPGAALLGAYNWAAFGAPWHLSYRYVANQYASDQAKGFFGIGLPRLRAIYDVFAWNGGLLVVSPVLVFAALGLARLARTHRAEAVVAGIVVALFVFIINCAYYDPYGGTSPGPRFLVPALPFLALGLGPAFAWRPRLTVCLAALSVIPITVTTLIWFNAEPMRGGPWGELARVPVQLRSSRFVQSLPASVLSAVGLGGGWGAVIVALGAVGAFVVALSTIPWDTIRARRQLPRRGRPRLRVVVAVGACCFLIAASNVLAITDFPYHADTPLLTDLRTSISTTSKSSYLGGETNFQVSVTDDGAIGATGISLTIDLSPGLRLVGPPAYTRGNGCTGTSKLRCDLGFLSPEEAEQATVFFGVQSTHLGPQRVTASTEALGHPTTTPASAVVVVYP